MENPVTSIMVSPDTLEASTEVTPFANGLRLDITVRNPANRSNGAIRVSEVKILFDIHPQLVMEHGWQSWSVVGPRQADRPRRSQRLSPAWVRGMLHADPNMSGHYVTGDQFLLTADGFGKNSNEAGIVGALSGKRNLTTIAAIPDHELDHTYGHMHNTASNATPSRKMSLQATCYLDGIVIGPGEERIIDPLYIASGDPGELYSNYADMVASESSARNNAFSPLGWCTWYHYYLKVSPEDIVANTLIAGRHGFNVMQIDDCFQSALGDWTTYNQKFNASKMEMLVDTIHSNGMEAGIWTAPFLASAKSAVLSKHPDWVCRDSRGHPLKANWNPIGWGGWGLALDTTNPAVLDHLRDTFSTLKERGWTYHKIDFLYAAAMPATRLGQDKYTRAEALTMGIQAVRNGIGDDAYLLGCGCPLAQAVGIVDALRVSPDTAALWSTHSLRLPGYPDTVPSLRSSLRMSLLRAPLHRRLWINDPDCILIRNTRTRLTPKERRIGAQVIAATGGLRIISDDLATYSSKEWELLEEINSTQKIFDRKLRILDPFASTIKLVPESTEIGNATPHNQSPSNPNSFVPDSHVPSNSDRLRDNDWYSERPSLHADILHLSGKSAHTAVIIPPKTSPHPRQEQP